MQASPLPLKGIEAADAWFEGIGNFGATVRYILEDIADCRISLVEIDGVEYFAMIDPQKWEAAISHGRQLLESGVGKRWSENTCRTLVNNLLPENARELRPFLWEKVSTLCHFTSDLSGSSILSSFGRGADQIVHAVLSDSDEPLHFSTIAALASDRAGRTIDVRRAHNAAASVGILLGRGIYGIDRHLPAREVLKSISEEAVEIVTSGPPLRQWHTSEILAALAESQTADPEISRLDKYVMDVALERSANLKRLGRMMWMQSDSTQVARIDIRQAVIAVLENAGRPLRTEEIRQHLVASRGLNSILQISPTDPLVRIDAGLWGLNESSVKNSQVIDLESRNVGLR